MNQKKDTLRKTLAVFIAETNYSNLSAAVISRAKLCLMDLVGVAIAGSRQPTSILARDVIGRDQPAGGATLWVSNRKFSPLTAAFLNAVQGHAIDMDDGHRYANGHPGVVTIPAAMALAESGRLNGKNLIEAIVIGYEVFIRLGIMCNPDLLKRGFHTTAALGVFSSAAVASKLLGLSVAETENALSLAGLQSAGLLEALSSGEMGKSFQVGRSVQGGILAALMAQRGADGPEHIFEGDKGFCRAFSGKACDSESVTRGLGETFQIQDVYFKRHAACRHIHSALDAIGEILAESPIDLAEIESIDVETYSIAKNLTGHLATQGSELAAKFSTPVAIGLLLVFGRTDALAFSEENISHPRVQSIAQKVSIRSSEAWDVVYPGKRGADVRIRTKDRTYSREVIYPKGEPEFPLSSEEFVGKYETNAGLVYSADRITRIREHMMNVEQEEIDTITMLLRAPD